MKKHYLLLLLLSLMALPLRLQAHNPNQSLIYLNIYEDGIGGQFEIYRKDLNRALGLDLKRGLTIEDVTPFLPQIQDYYLEHVAFSSTLGKYDIRFEETTIFLAGPRDFIQLHFVLDGINEVPDALDIYYNVLFDVHPTHRGYQGIQYNWRAGIHNNESMISLIFGPSNPRQQLDLTDLRGSSVMHGFVAMINSGMFHIFIGLDHILFLLALLLPGVVRRIRARPEPMVSEVAQVALFPSFLRSYANAWVPTEGFKASFIYVLKIVTFFTLAHTITLSLAALEIVKLPASFVEAVIALSIALAAMHNITPLVKGREWIIAFGFGLFHGFGFASVLGEIGLRGEYMTLSLLGFNIGVEVGQAVIICLIFPVLFLLRKTQFYKHILIYGSIVLILIALTWFTARIMGIELPIDNFIEKVYNKIFKLLNAT